MAEPGKFNKLRVLRETPQGLYLDGGPLGEILFPKRYILEGTRIGDELEVFVYRDSEDRLVATTETPRATAGQFAALRVVSTHPQMGAFLDWGLSKDLLLPIREQLERVRSGQRVVVFIMVDPQTGRIVASTRLNRFLDLNAPAYSPNQRVHLLIAGETPLGFKAIVENAHWGLLYRNELNTILETGLELEAYVRGVRPDGKIDLSLDQAGYQRVEDLSGRIIQALQNNAGRLALDDQSSPEAVREAFQVSKKAFKQAIGALYRERRIRFAEGGIELL